MKIWLLAAIVLCPAGQAATWHLSEQKGWQNVSDSPEAQFMLAVSQIRQTIVSGSKDEALNALQDLRDKFPQLSGPDLDAFIKAENEFVKNNLSKAAKLYTNFLEANPNSPFEPAAMERLYSIGAAYAGGQRRVFLKILKFPGYDEGEKILRNVSDRAGNSALAHRALVTLAESQERRKLFLDAYQTWAEITDRWPTGPAGQESLLRMARSLHAAYTSPHFDATVLRGAASYFEDYRKRYPAGAEEMQIPQTLELIAEQQAYKEFFTGLYYERIERIPAAQRYYRQVLEHHPDRRAAEMARRHLTAMEQGASELPPKNARRNLFDAGRKFLDNWFGLALIFDLPDGQQESRTAAVEDAKNS